MICRHEAKRNLYKSWYGIETECQAQDRDRRLSRICHSMDPFRDERYGYADRQASRRAHPQREQYSIRPSRRSVDTRQVIEDYERHSLEPSHHGDPRRRKSQKPDFKDSINDLHKVLADALRFYEGFRDSFDQEIRNIKPYARLDTLEQLWISKVKLATGRSTDDRGRRERDSNHRTTRQEAEVSFATTASEIIRSIHTSIEASKGVRQSEEREHAHNVYKKLNQIYRDVENLLKAAPHWRSSTNSLMTEIGMLLTLLTDNGAEQADHDGSNEHRRESASRNVEFDEQEERGNYRAGSGGENEE